MVVDLQVTTAYLGSQAELDPTYEEEEGQAPKQVGGKEQPAWSRARCLAVAGLLSNQTTASHFPLPACSITHIA